MHIHTKIFYNLNQTKWPTKPSERRRKEAEETKKHKRSVEVKYDGGAKGNRYSVA